jgi:uncharacterized protein (DUF1501 family)
MPRRLLLQRFGMGLGTIALADLMASDQAATALDKAGTPHPAKTHQPPKAKRIIYLFQSGAPSQLDLFDHKPLLNTKHGTQLPESVRKGQRLTAMSGNQSILPLAGSPFKFRQHGESGLSFSELLPHTASVADDLCVIRSMYTEAINHGPGTTFMQTGSQFPGRPSIGAWLDYGLASENSDLPAFVVMETKNKGGQPLVSRFWGSGFLPSRHQGVRFRAGKDPVLYLRNPAGLDATAKRNMLDALRKLHELQIEKHSSPALETRIAQHELSFRMQASIPEATDLASEPAHILDEYGKDSRTPGTFAANCVLARRLAERGVRFIQLYHQGWDQHGGLPAQLPRQTRETDQASAALVRDLKRRGLLDDTLVIWGGEFGRTNYCQGKLTAKSFGRDHHPRCFSLWMAGGGIKGGTTYGATDPFGYNIAENPVHIHDLHATILHLMGIDHKQLTFRYQGRRFRLTDVHGKVIDDVLS